MKVFKTKTELASYLGVSRPTIKTKLRNKEVKEIELGKAKGYIVVNEFIIYLLS